VTGVGTALPVSISNNTGGSITFNSTINSDQGGILVTTNTDTTVRFAGQTTLNTGANTAVSLVDNTNGGVRFDNLDITTTGTGQGFVASNTDNLTVQGTGNTITTANGVALSLTDVEVGAAGVTFASVTATGGTTAVVLDDVTGGTVTINGGTISGTTSDAVSVTGGANLSLNNMTITVSGVSGDGVNIDLTSNVASTISVANSTITSANGLGIDYNRGSLVANTTRLTLTGNTITTAADQGIGIDINGSGTANVIVNGGTQVNSGDDAALAITTSGGSGKTLNLLVDGSTFNNNSSTAAATNISTGGSGTINATVTNNIFNNNDATTGRGFIASTNSASSTLRLNLDANSATGGATDDPYLLDQNSGTFRVEDLATVQARNTGVIEQQGTITNDNGPIPTP
jgi:mucin-19